MVVVIRDPFGRGTPTVEEVEYADLDVDVVRELARNGDTGAVDWLNTLTAAGDFDESKHPRDSHGRFDGGGGTDEHGTPSPVDGWSIIPPEQMRREEADGLFKGMSRVSKLPPDELRVRVDKIVKDSPDIEAWRTADGKATVEFRKDSNLTEDEKLLTVQTFDALRRDDPLHELDLNVTVIPRQFFGTDPSVWGQTVSTGSNANVQIPADLYYPESQARIMQAGHDGWFSSAAISHPIESVLAHEYGHALDNDRLKVPERDAVRIDAARRAAFDGTAIPYRYGRGYPGSEQEAYAEAFAEWRYGDKPPSTFAQRLGKAEGWK